MTKQYALIPLTPTPQRFNITLSSTEYRLTFYFANAKFGGWMMNIADAAGNRILGGIPLVTGANLLEQYAYLGFSGRIWVQSAGDPDAVPTFQNLGIGSSVYWVTGT